MYACVLIPPEMSLVFALEPPTDLSLSRHPDPHHPTPRMPMTMTSSLWSNTALTPGTVFYPDEGEVRLERVADRHIMAHDDIRRAFGCYDVMLRVDGQEVRHCNWVRFVKTTDDPEAANIICSKGRGQPYYQVIKPVRANDEFVVFFNTSSERNRYPALSSVLPSHFTALQQSMFYPRPTYFQDGGGGMTSPMPAMLLRHYDKMMTSTPVSMKTGTKSSASHSIANLSKSSSLEMPTPVRYQSSSPQPPPHRHRQHHHHHHHPFSKMTNDSSLSPSSSFSSPLPKTPNQNECIDYSISRIVHNEYSLSSPIMTSSSLSRDSEGLSGIDTTHSIQDRNGADGSGSASRGGSDGNSGSGDNCNSFPGLSDSISICNRDNEDVDSSIVKKETDEDADESVNVDGKFNDDDDDKVIDDDNDEDDVNVDVDSTGVDLSMKCDNDEHDEDGFDDVESRIKQEHMPELVDEKVNEIQPEPTINKGLNQPPQNLETKCKPKIKEAPLLLHHQTDSSLAPNKHQHHQNVGLSRDVISETQITSSTPFIPPARNETSPNCDQSERAVAIHINQSRALDRSGEEVICELSHQEKAFVMIKPEAFVIGQVSSDMMTSRDSKPMKRCRERSWWPCETCGKKFDRPSLLKRHIRTHTGEKPHVCDVCGKAFSTSSSLNTHRRIHSGEKPHQCKVCGKRFTASSNLYYHRMTHNKEKPHKCTMCSKSFPTPGDLRSHQYIHSGSWPFRCHVCNRGFSKQTNLRNHMMLHSGDKPHECPKCGKKFALLCNLKTHCKTHDSTDSSDNQDIKYDDSTEETVNNSDNEINDSLRRHSNDQFSTATSCGGRKNSLDNSSDVITTTNKRKHSKISRDPHGFNSDQNVCQTKRHTDFSISKLTSSDGKSGDVSKKDQNNSEKSPSDYIPGSVLSDPRDFLKSVSSLSNAPLNHPLYRHFIAAATASQQQQQQQQHHQDQQYLHHHQQWLLSQGFNVPTSASLFNPTLTTLKDFNKSSLSPSSSPLCVKGINTPSYLTTQPNQPDKLNAIQFNTQLAPIPAFLTPEMMSLQRGGALMPTVPTIHTLPAFWGNQVPTNSF